LDSVGRRFRPSLPSVPNYRLTHLAPKDCLLKQSNLYLGKYIGFARLALNRSWDSFATSVRTGKPVIVAKNMKKS
jgi:hypothetical protein